ncbi:MAG: hypothetical protein K2K26_06325, partial [Muribaculaceae bacterium]|nr:hypothetical protein [Muribaculaceae bacterium]
MEDTDITNFSLQEFAVRIDEACRKVDRKGWYVVTDTNVEVVLAELFRQSEILSVSPRFTMTPGEANKTPQTLIEIWQWLSDNGAARQSGIINIG